MEYHVINQVVSGLEVESRALIEDIVRANRQTTLIIGSNHCGKSYLLTQLFNCDINSILNEGNYSEVRRLVAGDWFTLHAQVGKGVDYPDAIQQVNLQHRAQIAEKKLAKTKTIITSPYYNSLKVLDFYQK